MGYYDEMRQHSRPALRTNRRTALFKKTSVMTRARQLVHAWASEISQVKSWARIQENRKSYRPNSGRIAPGGTSIIPHARVLLPKIGARKCGATSTHVIARAGKTLSS